MTSPLGHPCPHSLQQACSQPCRLLLQSSLRHTTIRHNHPRQLRMEATGAIRDSGEITSMERRRLKEGEHAIIYRRSHEFHEVVDQRITPAPIRMEEATRQIEANGGERLTRLPFKDGVGVVEDRFGEIYDMACCLMKEVHAALRRSPPPGPAAKRPQTVVAWARHHTSRHGCSRRLCRDRRSRLTPSGVAPVSRVDQSSATP
jgi:hypothetical protein